MVEVYSKYLDLLQEYHQWETYLSKNSGSKVGHKETKSSSVILFIKFQQMVLLLQSKEFFLRVKIKWLETA